MVTEYIHEVDTETGAVVTTVVEVPPQPLDAAGATVTLLAVKGVITVEEAANIARVTPEDIVTEAQAWAAAADVGT